MAFNTFFAEQTNPIPTNAIMLAYSCFHIELLKIMVRGEILRDWKIVLVRELLNVTEKYGKGWWLGNWRQRRNAWESASCLLLPNEILMPWIKCQCGNCHDSAVGWSNSALETREVANNEILWGPFRSITIESPGEKLNEPKSSPFLLLF